MKLILTFICLITIPVACNKGPAISERKTAVDLREQRNTIDPDMNPGFSRKDLPEKKPVKTLSPFEKQMASLDSLFYTRVYNQRDTALAKEMIHRDFEFYHDQTGNLRDEDTALAFDIMIDRFRDIGNHYQRRLKPGSLRSYPLYNGKELYGALQEGINHYHKTETGALEGTGHFIHLWIREDEQWKLKRVISYDHRAWSR